MFLLLFGGGWFGEEVQVATTCPRYGYGAVIVSDRPTRCATWLRTAIISSASPGSGSGQPGWETRLRTAKKAPRTRAAANRTPGPERHQFVM